MNVDDTDDIPLTDTADLQQSHVSPRRGGARGQSDDHVAVMRSPRLVQQSALPAQTPANDRTGKALESIVAVPPVPRKRMPPESLG